MIKLEGRNPVEEALKQDLVTLVRIESTRNRDPRLQSIINYAIKKKVRIEEVSIEKLDNLSDTEHHQGIIAFAQPKVQWSIDKVLEETGKEICLLMLDRVLDPHNLGAIIRTSEAVGVDGIIIPKKGSAILSPTVHRVSMGGSLRVPVWERSLYPVLKKLRDDGVFIIGVDSKGSKSIYEENLAVPVVFIIGGEDRGISPTLMDKCDKIVRIPMRGQLQSLNVSVATAVVLYERLRQQEK
jgi:23S rRNA (guanosine2251-2'-O)-methyltransferase